MHKVREHHELAFLADIVPCFVGQLGLKGVRVHPLDLLRSFWHRKYTTEGTLSDLKSLVRKQFRISIPRKCVPG